MTQPNTILIMADNQPADGLGCYGNAEIQTPNIDKLAAKGTRFDQAFSVNAMCSPCRASVLTGLMPSQHGIHNWLDDQLMSGWPKDWCAIEEFPHLPGLLKQAGYATALIGKYHLGRPDQPQMGFDHWVTMATGHTKDFCDNEIIEVNQRYSHKGHSVELFGDKTLDYLKSRKDQDQPFFAFVPLNGPYGHTPAIKGKADNEFADLYKDCPMHSVPREGLNAEVLDRFALRASESGGQVREQFKGPLTLPNDLDSLRNYYSQISLVDQQVGRITQALEELGLDDNTIVIYTADHGFSLGHNGIWGHGAAAFPASAHRASYHIPLIVSGPGLRKGESCDELVSQIDLFPTILSMANAEVPEELPLAAFDHADWLQGGEDYFADAIYIEQEETRAVRTKDWLYASRFQHAPGYDLKHALFDLSQDPDERTDLAGERDYGHIAKQADLAVQAFFTEFSRPSFDLWNGGSAKSNSVFPSLWRDAWGEDWQPLEPLTKELKASFEDYPS